MKNNKKSIEEKIWDFINKHANTIFFLIITILALIARIKLFKYPSGDYDMFLKPWFDELKTYGGFSALGRNIGNYTPIYMTILAFLTYIPIDSLISIKIVSVIFDFVGGIYIIKIVRELLNKNKNKEQISLIIYAFYMFLPTIFINSAYWAQSDNIYTSFVLISLYYLLKNDFSKGILFWSIAFSFKFQAIFIFPIYILMYISNRKIKIKNFLIIPTVIFVMSIPKMIFTHNIFEGFKIYFDQSNTYSQYLTLNLPNVYSIFMRGYTDNNPNLVEARIQEMGTIGIIATIIIFAVIAFIVYSKKIKFEKESIIEFSLWSILIATFFLPQMHERYLFMGDVIGLVYLIINKKKYYIPILIELISLNGYMYLLFSGGAVNFSLVSITFFIMLILYSKEMYHKYFEE